MAQLIFIVLIAAVAYLTLKKFRHLRADILLGAEYVPQSSIMQRWQNVILIAFGQRKMFQNFTPAILHFFIYSAFLLTQIELIEIVIDGVFGTHRVFANALGSFYYFTISTIEMLSVLALVATFAFLYRRNLLKVPRLVKSELNGWPKLDANLILIGEILLITGIFTMNGADSMLQQINPAHYPSTGTLPISSWLGPMLFGGMDVITLEAVERFGWWLHLLVVLSFVLYLPFSKHLHIFLSFPNVYFANTKPRGEMENMPAIMHEVKSMLGLENGESYNVSVSDELPKFGANDVSDLTWKNIMDSFSCTECGRCTAACPANITGKKLSPRKIMMDVRDRATEVGQKNRSGKTEFILKDANISDALTKDNFHDGKSLFDYITKEEIRACTTCNACVDACPVLIDPLDIILKLRRYEILTESAGPPDWTPMFTALENQGSVWQMPQERAAWMQS